LLQPFQSDGTFHPIAAGRGLRRKAIRSAVATVTGSAGQFVVGMGTVVILARLLTPSDFGIVTMVTTFSLLLRSVGLNGFTELIMQREEVTDVLASNLFWINLGIGIILAVLFAGSGRLLASLFHTSSVVRVAQGMSLTIVIASTGYIHTGLLQRAMHFRTTAIINFVGQALQFGVSVVLAIAGWHYWALVWGSVVQTATLSVGAWLACRWIPSAPKRCQGTASGLKFAANVYSHYAFWYFTRNTDNFLVGWRFGDRALGFYKKAFDLFVLPQTQMMSPMNAVVVSTLSRVSGDREQFQRYFLRAVSVLALFGMGIGADFALVGSDIIRFLLGPGWEESGRIFALFGPGIGVMLLYYTHGWIHLSIGRPDRWFRWGLVEFVFTASLFLLGLHWGSYGIALAWTVSYFLLMLPGFKYAGKPIGLGIGPIFITIWKFFIASLVAGLATAAIVSALHYSSAADTARGALIRMVVVSLLFFTLYLASVIAFHNGHKPISETIGLIRELLPEGTARQTLPQPSTLKNSWPNDKPSAVAPEGTAEAVS
jgi:PST family polysaccharide transporter